MDRSGALQLDGEYGGSRAGAVWRGQAEDISQTIGRRLRQRRREISATQKEIARRAGVTYQQIQRYEAGAQRISAAMIWKLAGALDVGIPYLFGL
jgi:DNA-binding XRE family transcriptional regulator